MRIRSDISSFRQHYLRAFPQFATRIRSSNSVLTDSRHCFTALRCDKSKWVPHDSHHRPPGFLPNRHAPAKDGDIIPRSMPHTKLNGECGTTLSGLFNGLHDLLHIVWMEEQIPLVDPRHGFSLPKNPTSLYSGHSNGFFLLLPSHSQRPSRLASNAHSNRCTRCSSSSYVGFAGHRHTFCGVESSCLRSFPSSHCA